ncbi:MAG TPA: hypothetical protein VKB42_02780 [Dongiaceae bacterium]|nr:hypothetical protein [Dongiaceae bacterium]
MKSPKQGGYRGVYPRGGRKPGSQNKATVEVKDLCAQYTPAAIKELGRLALHAESEMARVAAIRELLDRRFGRPKQEVTVDANRSVVDFLASLASVAVGAPAPDRLDLADYPGPVRH